MPSLHKTSRDQAFSRRSDLGTGSEYINPNGSAVPVSRNDLMRGGNQSNEARDQDPAEMTPETLMHFIALCKNGLLNQDAQNETDEHNRFMQMLGEMVTAHHANGGDLRRVVRDQYPALSPRMAGDRRGVRERRPALDAATVQAINHRGFLARNPWAAHIKLSASGRY